MPKVGSALPLRDLAAVRKQYAAVVSALKATVKALNVMPKNAQGRMTAVRRAGRLNYRKAWLEAVGLERHGVNLEKELQSK